jgi:hypothetical protein
MAIIFKAADLYKTEFLRCYEQELDEDLDFTRKKNYSL